MSEICDPRPSLVSKTMNSAWKEAIRNQKSIIVCNEIPEDMKLEHFLQVGYPKTAFSSRIPTKHDLCENFDVNFPVFSERNSHFGSR